MINLNEIDTIYFSTIQEGKCIANYLYNNKQLLYRSIEKYQVDSVYYYKYFGLNGNSELWKKFYRNGDNVWLLANNGSKTQRPLDDKENKKILNIILRKEKLKKLKSRSR